MKQKKSRGLVQIPLLIGLLLMAIAIPLVTRLVQQNQENRGHAACTSSGTASCGSCCEVTSSNGNGTCNCGPVQAPIPTKIPVTCNCSCSANTLMGSICYGSCGQTCGGTKPLPTAIPTNKPVCTNGKYECTGSSLYNCIGGQWGFNQICAGGCNTAGTDCSQVPTVVPTVNQCSISGQEGTCVASKNNCNGTFSPSVACGAILAGNGCCVGTVLTPNQCSISGVSGSCVASKNNCNGTFSPSVTCGAIVSGNGCCVPGVVPTETPSGWTGKYCLTDGTSICTIGTPPVCDQTACYPQKGGKCIGILGFAKCSILPTAIPTINYSLPCDPKLSCAYSPLTGQTPGFCVNTSKYDMYCCPAGQVIYGSTCVTPTPALKPMPTCGTVYCSPTVVLSGSSRCTNYSNSVINCCPVGMLISGSACVTPTNVPTVTPIPGAKGCGTVCASGAECKPGLFCTSNNGMTNVSICWANSCSSVPTATPTKIAGCQHDNQCSGPCAYCMVSGGVSRCVSGCTVPTFGPTGPWVPNPTATGKPNPTNPPAGNCTQCPNNPTAKGKGDADCNGATAINDASIWRAEFISGGLGATVKNTWGADFDCDGKVTLNDFSIWRSNFIKGL